MSAYPSDIDTGTSWPVEVTRRMNRMYRRQRHIYNATRRYYLLGRDRLIVGLRPEGGASVLEIGCGTGRNLVLAARLHPKARFFGIDVSTGRWNGVQPREPVWHPVFRSRVDFL
jgi:S-adenosylmethionine-diacylgycerolhomoserine-N-methlytransferase